MKKITINGKHNIETIQGKKKQEERNVAKYDEPLLKDQLISINKYYMDIDDIYSKSIKAK